MLLSDSNLSLFFVSLSYEFYQKRNWGQKCHEENILVGIAPPSDELGSPYPGIFATRPLDGMTISPNCASEKKGYCPPSSSPKILNYGTGGLIQGEVFSAQFYDIKPNSI